MPTLEQVQEQIKKLDSMSSFLARKEIKELPKILQPTENVELLIQGQYNGGTGVLVATNSRLIFIDKGFFSLKVEDFGYDKITSVQYDLGMMFGSLTILASSNKAVIDYMDKTQTRVFGEFVRNKLNTPKNVAPSQIIEKAPEPKNKMDAMIEQLEKLAKLKELGIITEEEFIEQKKRLLDMTK